MKAICAACDDNFVPHFATMMISTHLATPGSTFFLAPINMSSGNIEQLQSFASKMSADLRVLDTGNLDLSRFIVGGIWSSATWARIFMPQLLPAELDKVLYLDCDIVVLKDLSRLFELEMGGHAIAATPEPVTEGVLERKRVLGIPDDAAFFNSGSSLMNLVEWRKRGLGKRIADFALAHPEKLALVDMCAINAILAVEAIPLGVEYNFQPQIYAMDGFDPAIIHFSAKQKPWKNRVPAGGYLYRHFRNLTPWPFRWEESRSTRIRHSIDHHRKFLRRTLLALLGMKHHRQYAKRYLDALHTDFRLRRMLREMQQRDKKLMPGS